MSIMTIITATAQATVDIRNWSERAVQAVKLSYESDGYHVTIA